MTDGKCCGSPGSSVCSCASFLSGRVTLILSVAVLALFVLNCAFAGANRGFQNDILAAQQQLNEKSQKVNQNRTLVNIYQGLAQALVVAANTKKDPQIRDLLAKNNIRFEPPAKTPAAK